MKEKILKESAKIISQKGVMAASTRAICEAVGISAPTLYHYFRDKNQLVNEVTSLAFERHRKHIQWSDQPKDILSNLKQAWDNYMDFAVNERDLYLMVIQSMTQGQVFQAGVDCFQQLVKAFSLAEEKNLLKYSALESAQIYLGAAQGVALVTLADKSSESLQAISRKCRDLTLDGLLRPR